MREKYTKYMIPYKFSDESKSFVSGKLSYFDIVGEPENTYHLLLLVMFAYLQVDYWIKSNRESGLGRRSFVTQKTPKQLLKLHMTFV
ncbi:MAG TPA: hypothetical protein PLO84_01875 [Thermotogota bacterium]|nr:hypothetical protein [Thermotogota bacterium]